MLSDELTLAALREKVARLAALGDIGNTMYALYLAEIPRLMKWIVGVPMLKAFVEEIRTMHDDEERELRSVLVGDAKEMAEVAARFRSVCQTKSEQDPDWPGPLRWSVFDDAIASLTAPTASSQSIAAICEAAGLASMVLHGHAKAALDEVIHDASAARARTRIAQQDIDRMMRLSPPPQDGTELLRKALSDAMAAEVVAERQDEIVPPLTTPPSDAAGRCSHHLGAWELVQKTSPRASLNWLIGICQAQHPPLDGVRDWTDDVLHSPAGEIAERGMLAHLEASALSKDPGKHFGEARVHLGRFVEELLVLGASGLSSQIVVSRFKERSIHYDKPRLREIARRKGSGGRERKGDGTREDRLTFELAKYLHDNGIFVFVRLRMSNLEPDAVGIRRLAVESKAYASAKGARDDIVQGYYQLYDYLTALDTDAMRVSEGFLVIFRLDEGPIYETPRTIYTGRFRMHSLTIDIATSKTSGRNQSKTVFITEKEIFGAIEKRGTTAAKKSVKPKA